VRPAGRETGIVLGGVVCAESGERVEVGGAGFKIGEVFVGAELIMCVIRSGTEEGVTLSTIVKAGRRRTVVEFGMLGFSGTGMLEAESMSFYVLVRLGSIKINRSEVPHSHVMHCSSQQPP
jgi:hypothetical protein